MLSELQGMVDQYEPDFIGLNEVMQPTRGNPPFVLEFLKKSGYVHNHFAHPARFNDDWLVAAAFASRPEITAAKNIVVSKNGFAAKRGYPGFDKEAISARVTLPGGRSLKIMVAHPLALLDAPKDHYTAIKTLDRLLHSKEYASNTILVGDMNEWRFIPRSFRAAIADVMYHKTGSFAHPTWRHNGYRFTPIRANLDRLYWSKQSDFRLQDFRVLSSRASDHRPFLATFRFD